MADETDPAEKAVTSQPSDSEEGVEDVREKVDEQMGDGERLGDVTNEGKGSPPRSDP